jgi:hypothetical protein
MVGTVRKRRRKQDDEAMMPSVSPESAALQLPSIDEYDLSGLFAQSMDDTLRIDRSFDDENSRPDQQLSSFGSILGKLESFTAGRRPTLSTVPSETPEVTALVPAQTQQENSGKPQTCCRKMLIEHEGVFVTKFDPLFRNLSFYYSQPCGKKVSEAVGSFIYEILAQKGWGVIQIPASFNTVSSIVVWWDGEWTCSVTRLESRRGDVVGLLNDHGVAFYVLTEGDAGTEDEDDDISTEIPEIIIKGRVDIIGFIDWLRLELIESKKVPTIVSSCAYLHGVFGQPKISVDKQFSQVDKIIVPLHIVRSSVASRFGSRVKCTVDCTNNETYSFSLNF